MRVGERFRVRLRVRVRVSNIFSLYALEVNTTLKLYAARVNPSLDSTAIASGVEAFMKKIEEDAFR